MKGPDLRFTLSDVAIFDVQAAKRNGSEGQHASWIATYEEAPRNRARVVVATLHAGDEDSQITVTAGAQLVASSRSAVTARGDDLAEIVKTSLALETLYDILRMHVRTLLGMLDVELDIPFQSPDAEVQAFNDDGKTSSDAENASN